MAAPFAERLHGIVYLFGQNAYDEVNTVQKSTAALERNRLKIDIRQVIGCLDLSVGCLDLDLSLGCLDL